MPEPLQIVLMVVLGLALAIVFALTMGPRQ